MHIGSSSTNPAASPDAPEGVGGTLAFNNSMASLADWLFSGKLIQFPKLKLAYSEGQIGWIPYALERADTVWEQHDSWQHSKELIPEPPSTYYYGRIFGCFTADRHGLHSLDRGRRGQHLLRDRLPAHRHHVAELARVRREDARRLRRRRRLQGAARQRDPDARARPHLSGGSPPPRVPSLAIPSLWGCRRGPLRVMLPGRDGGLDRRRQPDGDTDWTAAPPPARPEPGLEERILGHGPDRQERRRRPRSTGPHDAAELVARFAALLPADDDYAGVFSYSSI